MTVPQIELMDIVALYEAYEGISDRFEEMKAEFSNEIGLEADKIARKSKNKLHIDSGDFDALIKLKSSVIEKVNNVPIKEIIDNLTVFSQNLAEIEKEAGVLSSYMVFSSDGQSLSFDMEDQLIALQMPRVVLPGEKISETLETLLSAVAPFRKEGVNYPSHLDIDVGMYNNCFAGLEVKPYSQDTGKYLFQIGRSVNQISIELTSLIKKFELISDKIFELGMEPGKSDYRSRARRGMSRILKENGYSGEAYEKFSSYDTKARFVKKI